MKVMLVGNLPEDCQESMLRFLSMMRRGLEARGHSVIETSPRLRLARAIGNYSYAGWRKYLGYWDKFVLFPRHLAHRIHQEAPDVIHVVDHANAVYAKQSPERSVVTCHDLQQIRAARGEIPQQRVGRMGRQYQKWIMRQIRESRNLVAVSNKTAADLARVGHLSPEKISVIPNALNDPFAPVVREEALGRIIPFLRCKGIALSAGLPPFVLNVGGGQWYKNRPGLLRIFAQLHAKLPERPWLLMVGKPLATSDQQIAKDLGVSERLIQVQDVPNPELNALYSLAEGLLFPSLEEGFGWPLAEAQACGCPVFTSNRSPMCEVAGPSAVLFDPEKPEIAAQAILQAWPRRFALADAARPSAERWSPETMLRAYEKIYQRITAQRS